jgi:hypothetical protein
MAGKKTMYSPKDFEVLKKYRRRKKNILRTLFSRTGLFTRVFKDTIKQIFFNVD